MQDERQLPKAERQRLVASLVERMRLGTQQELLDALAGGGLPRHAGDRLARHPRARPREDARPARPAALRRCRTASGGSTRARRSTPLLEQFGRARGRRAEHRRRPVRDRLGAGDRARARPARASARRRHARRRRHVPRDRRRTRAARASSPTSCALRSRLDRAGAARAHGCAASSCAASRKSDRLAARAGRSAGRRPAARRRPRTAPPRPAGPVTLTIGVNGVNSPPRANCSHGSSGSNTQPIGTGSFASPGVSTTSTSSQNATIAARERAAARRPPARSSTLDVSRAAAASARLSGSSSDSSRTGIERRRRAARASRTRAAATRRPTAASARRRRDRARRARRRRARATSTTRGSTGVRDRRLGRERDAQPARVGADLVEERPLRRRRPVRVARLVARDHVEERRRVADA